MDGRFLFPALRLPLKNRIPRLKSRLAPVFPERGEPWHLACPVSAAGSAGQTGMGAKEHNIKHVVFYAGLRPGHLMLAEMTDGSYCLLRDDSLTPLQCWAAHQLRDAIDRYQELKAQLAPPTS